MTMKNNVDKQKVCELLMDILNACEGFLLDRDTHTYYQISRENARKIITGCVFELSYMIGSDAAE